MFIYSAAIEIFKTGIKVAAPFNTRAAQLVEGHKDLLKLIAKTIEGGGEIVWFHAASLGEFEQGRSLIERYKREHPNTKTLLTFFSPSGYEIRKNYEGADYIFYIPYDIKSDVKAFLDIVKPKAIFFIKYEFWLNFLEEIAKRKIPCYLVSAIFDNSQHFFKWYGSAFRKALKSFTTLFVQNENSRTLLKSIGIENVIVAGDTRFDRVVEITNATISLPKIEAFKGDHDILISGSSWEPDDQIVISLIEKFGGRLKFIIAPHQIGENKIVNIVKDVESLGFKVARYTKNSAEEIKDADLLIIDTIGILSSAYKYAKFGVIGGGFGVGIHNTLEAATFGLPLIFGGNYLRFKEAVDLVELGAATPISNKSDAERWLEELLGDKNIQEKRSKLAKEYVNSHSGATDIILKSIEK